LYGNSEPRPAVRAQLTATEEARLLNRVRGFGFLAALTRQRLLLE
jgi:hypothetical protein